jgi:hypothetical protein
MRRYSLGVGMIRLPLPYRREHNRSLSHRCPKVRYSCSLPVMVAIFCPSVDGVHRKIRSHRMLILRMGVQIRRGLRLRKEWEVCVASVFAGLGLRSEATGATGWSRPRHRPAIFGNAASFHPFRGGPGRRGGCCGKTTGTERGQLPGASQIADRPAPQMRKHSDRRRRCGNQARPAAGSGAPSSPTCGVILSILFGFPLRCRSEVDRALGAL